MVPNSQAIHTTALTTPKYKNTLHIPIYVSDIKLFLTCVIASLIN